MAILLDTNILLRAVQKQHVHNVIVGNAIDRLVSKGEGLCFTQQNIVEFCAVSTRPVSANGLGFTVGQAFAELEELHKFFFLLPEQPIHSVWEELVLRYRVSGKNVHDTHLVAAMIAHGVDRILTFNTQDFLRYTEIEVLDPVLIAQS
jgi:predicted nucleic acid-binding protein